MAVLFEAPDFADTDAVTDYCREHGVSGNQHGMARMLARAHHEDAQRSMAGTVSALSPIAGNADYSPTEETPLSKTPFPPLQHPGCHCRFDGDLTSMDHRRFHREWEKSVMGRGPTYTEATQVEVTQLMVQLDRQGAAIRVLSAALGIEVPLGEPTYGEAGWLAQHARETT